MEDDFLACGSETSELFVYYKALSKPVAQQSFSAHGEDGTEAQVPGQAGGAGAGARARPCARAQPMLPFVRRKHALLLRRIVAHPWVAAPRSHVPPGLSPSPMQSDKGFISAVCWRPRAHTLLAANSQGTVKIFSLTGSSGHM